MDGERKILLVPYEDGTKALREVVSIFEAKNGRTYAALYPLENGDAPLELVRATPCTNEEGEQDYALSPIRSDMEYEIAVDALCSQDIREPDGDIDGNTADDVDTDLEEKLGIVSLLDENGNSTDYAVVDVFLCKGRKYAALLPVEQMGGENMTVTVYRAEREFFPLTEKDGPVELILYSPCLDENGEPDFLPSPISVTADGTATVSGEDVIANSLTEIIEITDESGEVTEWAVVENIFANSAKEQNYMVLVPVTALGSVTLTVTVFRMETGFNPIPDDTEFIEAMNAFLAKLTD